MSRHWFPAHSMLAARKPNLEPAGQNDRGGDLGFRRRVDDLAVRGVYPLRDASAACPPTSSAAPTPPTTENAWAKFERAEVDIEAFDDLFAAESRALGAEVRGKDVLPLLSGDLRPEMVEALKRVKAKFKTGCITNNLPANAIGGLGGRTLYVAEVMALFDMSSSPPRSACASPTRASTG